MTTTASATSRCPSPGSPECLLTGDSDGIRRVSAVPPARRNLRLVCSAGSSYNRDYYGEMVDGHSSR